MDSAEWEALQARDYAQFLPAEQAALHFADKLTSEPDNVTDADFAALKQFFSAEQVVDLDVLVEMFNATTRPAKVTES
jgi:alkylhydroperoxidase family enzyme